MGLLRVIKDAPGYLKATFQGPQGSGKTFTAAKLLCFAHKHFGSKRPVAFFDTEGGSDYVVPLIKDYTGLDPLRIKTRSFAELLEAVRECQAGAADFLLVDSITHVWRELNDAYLRKINEGRQYQKSRLTIEDIMQVKNQWQPWLDAFSNSKVHMIVCGREGNEWGNQENEETGRLELVQVGKKMKVEAEFGYEASLQVAMHSEQRMAKLVKKKKQGNKAAEVEKLPRTIVNVATIIKDRFDVMNGSVIEYPDGEHFMPFLQRLNPAAFAPVDNAVKSDNIIQEADSTGSLAYEKRQKAIACEEIQGECLRVWPGATAKEKLMKAAIIHEVFGTRSWTAVESMDSPTLKVGLEKMRQILKDPAAFEEKTFSSMPGAQAA